MKTGAISGYKKLFMENSMKKQFIALTVLALSMSVAQAKPLYCPFTETFYIDAVAGVKLLSLTPDPQDPHQNLSGTPLDETSFTIAQDSCETVYGGSLIARVGYNDAEYCDLTIQDGPYQWSPTVPQVYCSGGHFLYTGMDGSAHKYHLHFNNQLK